MSKDPFNMDEDPFKTYEELRPFKDNSIKSQILNGLIFGVYWGVHLSTILLIIWLLYIHI